MYAIAYDCEGRAVWTSDIPHAAAMAARDLDRANPAGAPHFAEVVDPGATESGSHARAWLKSDDIDDDVTLDPEQAERWRTEGWDVTPLAPADRAMECRSVFSDDDLRRILDWHEEVRSTCGISADDDNLRKRIVGALRNTEQESEV